MTQYGVELDVPAATILSIFGLRAQVRDIVYVAVLYSDLALIIVILVAEHLASGDFLCRIHRSQLHNPSLLRQGETVTFCTTRIIMHILILEHISFTSFPDTNAILVYKLDLSFSWDWKVRSLTRPH